ncbi:MAG: hypothetical protein DYH08_09385 [Actinobacteria bacterium ATB1]|nr:hypothetical protein [Actinobacteria bacterium ATB1]
MPLVVLPGDHAVGPDHEDRDDEGHPVDRHQISFLPDRNEREDEPGHDGESAPQLALAGALSQDGT